MNKYNYTKIKPFKWFVLENFPFIEDDFDALTNWQLFSKIGKEINTIIDSQNNVGSNFESVVDSFIALEKYVINYFKNLDVQDEINNKLDEMVKDGTLDNILNNYAKVDKIYDTIQDVIEDTTIVENMHIKTLGYYAINDGGNGEYIIVDNETTADGGSLVELDNGLKAQLIYNNTINLMQFGAKNIDITGDVTTIATQVKNADSSDTALNNAISYILSLANSHITRGYQINLHVPAGNYIIRNVVNLSPLVHIVSDGLVNFYVDNSALTYAFKIGTINTELDPYIAGALNSRYISPVLDGRNGTILIQNVDDNTSTVAVGCGGYNSLSKAEPIKLDTVDIVNFGVGIELFLKNLYLCKFSNIRINNCNKCIQTNASSSSSNSGENILFENCAFSISNCGIYFHTYITNLKFVDCSFDGIGCVFYQDVNLTADIILERCWVEAIGSKMGTTHEPINFNNIQAFIYITNVNNPREYQRTRYILNNTKYTDSSSTHDGCALDYLFNGTALDLTLNNFMYVTWQSYSNTQPQYLCADNVKHIKYNNYMCSPYMNSPFISKYLNLMQYPTYARTSTKTLTLAEDTEVGLDLLLKEYTNVGTLEIVNDSWAGSGKLLKLTKSDITAETTLSLETKFFIKNHKSLKTLGRIYVRPESGAKEGTAENFRLYYYDIYGTNINIQSYQENNADYWKQDDYGFWYPTYIQSVADNVYTTQNARKAKGRFTVTLPANQTSSIVYIRLPEIFDNMGLDSIEPNS